MAQELRIPYFVREVCRQLAELLDEPWMGIPMEVRMPARLGTNEDGIEDQCKLRYECAKSFTLNVRTGVKPTSGEFVEVTHIMGKIKFPSQMEAVDWIKQIERVSGDLDWHTEKCDTRETLYFIISGLGFERLKLAVSNRKRGLPVLTWFDPNHPYNQAQKVLKQITIICGKTPDTRFDLRPLAILCAMAHGTGYVEFDHKYGQHVFIFQHEPSVLDIIHKGLVGEEIPLASADHALSMNEMSMHTWKQWMKDFLQKFDVRFKLEYT